MMKKSLLAFATIALTTGAWGETVQHLGVTYEYTPVVAQYDTTDVENGDQRVLNSAGATSGELTFSGNYYQVATGTAVQNVSATALYLATPTFESWSETTTTTGNSRQNGSYYVTDASYNSIVGYILGGGSVTLYTWDQVKANGDGDFFKGWQKPANGSWTSPDLRTSESAFETYFNGSTTSKGTYRPSASNFVFYKEITSTYDEIEDEYTDVVYYYAIYKLSTDVTTIVNTTTTTNYTPTTIPSGLNWDGVTTVTISSSITSIDNEAFRKNAGSIEKFIIKNNDKFGFDENILFTISPNNEVIFFSSLLNGTPAVTLNGAVEVVRPYATKYITQSMIVYYSSDEFTVPDAEKQGENVTFVNANDPIVMEDNGKGDGGMKVKNGTLITGSQFDAAITSYINSATYLDFTGADFGNLTKSITNNYNNKLILIGKSTNISGVNIVYIDENDDRVCDNFQLDDNYKTGAFFNPVSFTAKSAQYNRTFTEKWASIILPFGSNTIPSGFNCGTIQKYEQANNEITFTSVSSVTANVPYLIYSDTESTLPVFNNVNVVPTTESKYSSQVNGATLTALYEPAYVKSGSEETYIFSEGRIFYVPSTLTNGAKINCFRGYITTPAGTYNPEGGAATIRFINESETAIETITTTNNKDNDAIYNINGQRVSGMNANGIYVKNGKKIIVK